MAAVAAAKTGAKVVDAVGGKGTSMKIGLGILGAVALGVVFMLITVTAIFGSVMSVMAGTAAAAEANCNGGSSAASPLALQDIPAVALDAYQKAGTASGVNWTFIAAIGGVESGHGSFNHSVLGVNGQVTPPILGVVLNGSGAGGNTTAMRDTDKGVYDGNTAYDRAVGPMQFMPSTWLSIGQDGNFDGKKDPQNIFDAALAAGMYLKASGAPADMTTAIMAYNHSMQYVTLVRSWADKYATAGGAGAGGVTAVNASATLLPQKGALGALGSAWALPMTSGSYTLTSPFGPRSSPAPGASTKHQGQDFGTPIGTPVMAVGAGQVINAGPADGFGNWIKIKHGGTVESVYGHISVILVKTGDFVLAGQLIAKSGNEGISNGPHLHLEIHQGGVAIDPIAFLAGNHANPANVPAGCGTPADSLPAGDTGKILEFALSKLGKPYVFGGVGPEGYDCSGLTSAAYLAAGIPIPRTSQDQWAWAQGVAVPSGQERAGDLIFFHGPNPGHVGIVLNPATKTMVHAPETGDVVKIAPYNDSYWAPALVGFKRAPGTSAGPAAVASQE